ncbi:MAG TPA: ABC transporter substrate-binding protein [Hyphomicrobiaceae bacterium]|jgi:putative ABC transport system substrate-binding protein|nr:ABC transporter substrate-binding protein [Hyphomicrobiaceae bacterium]
MRRRECIALLGGVGAAWPFIARTQQTTAKRIGVVLQGGPYYAGVEGLREGLKATGLEDGKQIMLVIRDAKGDAGAAAAAARELEGDRVELIVVLATTVARATKDSTANVPIVFAAGRDPVASGFVDTMSKPGGRLTGVHFLTAELTGKRLRLLREIVPTLRRIVTFHNPANPVARYALEEARSATRLLNIDLVDHEVSSPADIRSRLTLLGEAKADAYFFISDSLVNSYGTLILEAANALKMPTMVYELDLVAKGALAGYGLNYREIGRLAAKYVSRVLSGTRPSDLPVETLSQPALAINRRTARALGLAIPSNLLARADEVIE